jgi:hypothetical protein
MAEKQRTSPFEQNPRSAIYQFPAGDLEGMVGLRGRFTHANMRSQLEMSLLISENFVQQLQTVSAAHIQNVRAGLDEPCDELLAALHLERVSIAGAL